MPILHFSENEHHHGSFVSALTGAPAAAHRRAPASRRHTRALTFHFYIYSLLQPIQRSQYLLIAHCNRHDRQAPRFGSNSDSRLKTPAQHFLEKTPCTDMRQRRRAPSTTKRSPCCPDVTDPPRAPSLARGAQQQPSPPHRQRAARAQHSLYA
jgi:hypothetical protein